MLSPLVINSNLEEKEEKNIFVESNGKLYEYEIRFNHMNVVDAIESYVKNETIYNFTLVNENQAKIMGTPIKFLPYMGEFKLEGSLKKTKNYLSPLVTYFLNFLNNKYKDNIITSDDLKSLYELKKMYEKDSRINELEIFENLCYGIRVSLINTYDFNEDVGKNILLGFENRETNEEFKIVLEKIRELITVSTANNKYIKGLNLRDELLNPIYEKEEVKKKVY